jgi:hypothetical protein
MKAMRIPQPKTAIRWAFALGLCLAVLLLFSADLSAQCAMCRTALTQSAEGQRWSRGINAGIMLLLAAPFLIAGVIFAVIFQSQLLQGMRRIRARVFPGGAYQKADLSIPR